MAHILFLIILLASVSCGGPLIGERAKTPLNPANLAKTVYIDKSFNAWQVEAIIEALNKWECSTGGLVRFTIHIDYDIQTYDRKLLGHNPLIVEKVYSDDKRIVKAQEHIEEKESKGKWDGIKRYVNGLYTYRSDNITPTILLVDNTLRGFGDYKSVMLHEAGHSLGADHPEEPDTIMYAHRDKGSQKLTQNDLRLLCNLYWCDAEKMSVCN